MTRGVVGFGVGNDIVGQVVVIGTIELGVVVGIVIIVYKMNKYKLCSS